MTSLISASDAFQDAIDRLNIATYTGNIDRVLEQLGEITNLAPGKLQDVISAALLEAGAGGQLKILKQNKGNVFLILNNDNLENQSNFKGVRYG